VRVAYVIHEVMHTLIVINYNSEVVHVLFIKWTQVSVEHMRAANFVDSLLFRQNANHNPQHSITPPENCSSSSIFDDS
jgi:hypothetical protein